MVSFNWSILWHVTGLPQLSGGILLFVLYMFKRAGNKNWLEALIMNPLPCLLIVSWVILLRSYVLEPKSITLGLFCWSDQISHRRIHVHSACASQLRDLLFHRPKNKYLKPMVQMRREQRQEVGGDLIAFQNVLPDPPYFSPLSSWILCVRGAANFWVFGGMLGCKYFILNFSHSCRKNWLFLSFQDIVVVSSILLVPVG